LKECQTTKNSEIMQRNPNWYKLIGMFMVAMLLFALGSKASPVMGRTHDQLELTMPPPLHINIAIAATPEVMFINAPVVTAMQVYKTCEPVQTNIQVVTTNAMSEQPSYIVDGIASDLGLRQAPQACVTLQKSTPGHSPTNYQRGVKTRLDIGEF
jgi:hypothetical protein